MYYSAHEWRTDLFISDFVIRLGSLQNLLPINSRTLRPSSQASSQYSLLKSSGDNSIAIVNQGLRSLLSISVYSNFISYPAYLLVISVILASSCCLLDRSDLSIPATTSVLLDSQSGFTAANLFSSAPLLPFLYAAICDRRILDVFGGLAIGLGCDCPGNGHCLAGCPPIIPLPAICEYVLVTLVAKFIASFTVEPVETRFATTAAERLELSLLTPGLRMLFLFYWLWCV